MAAQLETDEDPTIYFYITGEGQVIHWLCEWSWFAPSGRPSKEALHGLAAAHLRQGCDGMTDRKYYEWLLENWA